MTTIAVDVDDVLFDWDGLFRAWAERSHGVTYTPADLAAYGWSAPFDDWAATALEFLSEPTVAGAPPLPGARAATVALARHVRLVAITNRATCQLDVTTTWLATHLPGVFRDVVCCDERDRGGSLVPKADVCAEIAAVALIDDLPANLSPLVGTQTSAVLFDRGYPWARQPTERHVVRVSGWAGAEAVLWPITRRRG